MATPPQLNILYLYHWNPGREARISLWNHIFFLSRLNSSMKVAYANCFLHVPWRIMRLPWDAILIDVTLCCGRWASGAKFAEYERVFQNLGNATAPKIAFPQDDYTRPAIMDEWLISAKVDVLYSVLSGPFDVLYPQYSKIGKIRLAYTGYVDEKDIEVSSRPLRERSIDVGYRARKLPAHYGRIGQAKWLAAERFKILAEAQGFSCDISTSPSDTIFGTAWRDFIADSKFTFGTSSGSSVIDFRGEVGNKERAILRDNPDATFEEIEAAAFPGQDGKYSMTAISPRNIEAALLRSCQILIEGQYSEILQPWEDYIPLAADFSNLDAVFKTMGDLERCQAIADHCYSTIVNCESLRYRHHAIEIKGDISRISSERGKGKERQIDRMTLRIAGLAIRASSGLAMLAFRVRVLRKRIRQNIVLRVKAVIGEANTDRYMRARARLRDRIRNFQTR